MEEDYKIIISSAMLILLQEVMESSSESESEEVEIIQRFINMQPRRYYLPRIENYVDTVVAALTARDFKAHFRYY